MASFLKPHIADDRQKIQSYGLLFSDEDKLPKARQTKKQTDSKGDVASAEHVVI